MGVTLSLITPRPPNDGRVSSFHFPRSLLQQVLLFQALIFPSPLPIAGGMLPQILRPPTWNGVVMAFVALWRLSFDRRRKGSQGEPRAVGPRSKQPPARCGCSWQGGPHSFQGFLGQQFVSLFNGMPLPEGLAPPSEGTQSAFRSRWQVDKSLASDRPGCFDRPELMLLCVGFSVSPQGQQVPLECYQPLWEDRHNGCPGARWGTGMGEAQVLQRGRGRGMPDCGCTCICQHRASK